MKIALVSYWINIDQLIPELQYYNKIFACEEAGISLLKRGIDVIKIISDFDSVDYDHKYSSICKKVSSDKNESDTRIMVNYIDKKYKYDELIIYNEFSDRVDHSLSILSLLSMSNNCIKVKTQKSLLFLLKDNKINTLRKINLYTYISFVALSDVYDLHIRGLKYSGFFKKITQFSDRTISNKFIDNKATISYTYGNILCIFSHD